MNASSKKESVAVAVPHCIVSTNESDSNFEVSSVVDGLFAAARALDRIAAAIGNDKGNK